MARRGKQNPRDRWRQIRVSEARGKRTVKRRGRVFDPDRWTGAHRPRPNPKFRLKGKVKGTRRIDVPPGLNCKTPEEWSELLRLLAEIQTAALQGNLKRLVLDFSDVTSMSPEAAITLVAEIQRCRAFCGSRTQVTGTYPSSHDVASLLTEVGFFKALDVRPPVLPAAFRPRSYLQIERNNKTTPEIADRLLDCFSEVFDFDDHDRKRLHVALVECMDNVFEHAYAVGSHRPDLIREWWLAGYADHDLGTIGFSFYDQGVGIPSTIKARQKLRLLRALSSWSDGQWIQRAVRKGVSRHDSRRRGHGLEKLREFVERLDVQGSLQVVANRGSARFETSGESAVYEIGGNLHGTIIIWQLAGVSFASGGAAAAA